MNILENYMKTAKAVSGQIREWMSSVDMQAFSAASTYFGSQFHKDAAQVSSDLSNNGWFIWLAEGSLEDSFLRIKSFLGKNQNDQEKIASEYITSEVNNIKAQLLSTYPDRKNIISEIFMAHEMELFGASIPALFSLAEGICRDQFPGIGLYATVRDTKQPKTTTIFDLVSQLDVFESAILEPLKIKTGVTKTINNPSQSDHEIFNRHLIIHGNSKRYSSHINSLKAIALANYVHQSLSHIKQNCTQT